MKRRGRAGLTLAEAIISIFIMVFGFLITARLFQTAIRYQTMVDTRGTAVILAERQLERVRGWSRKAHACPGGSQPFSDWSGCPGLATPVTDPDYSGYTIQVTAGLHDLYSPCSLFEKLYSGPEQRRISRSVREVTVRVSWGNQQYSLVSLVGLPTGEPRLTNPVTVGLSQSGNLSKDQRMRATPVARNQMNQLLEDVFFLYSIRPSVNDQGGGNGAVQPDRDGREAYVRNCIYDVTPASVGGPLITGYGYGRCSVVATGRYRGKLVQGASDEFEMSP